MFKLNIGSDNFYLQLAINNHFLHTNALYKLLHVGVVFTWKYHTKKLIYDPCPWHVAYLIPLAQLAEFVLFWRSYTQ